ncbi:MAG: hypothetical protein IKQ29_01395 [Bacilli bacterium]|nr:hypothetical protein [Bacilli bacterium]
MQINKYIIGEFGILPVIDEGGGGVGGVSSQSLSTICDSDAILEFAKGLRTRATTLEDNVSDILSIVDNMPQNEAWDGKIYAQFKTKVHSYENPMKAYVALIREYANTLDLIQKYGVDTLEPSVKKYSEGNGS